MDFFSDGFINKRPLRRNCWNSAAILHLHWYSRFQEAKKIPANINKKKVFNQSKHTKWKWKCNVEPTFLTPFFIRPQKWCLSVQAAWPYSSLWKLFTCQANCPLLISTLFSFIWIISHWLIRLLPKLWLFNQRYYRKALVLPSLLKPNQTSLGIRTTLEEENRIMFHQRSRVWNQCLLDL